MENGILGILLFGVVEESDVLNGAAEEKVRGEVGLKWSRIVCRALLPLLLPTPLSPPPPPPFKTWGT
jgi:hypothetical protein